MKHKKLLVFILSLISTLSIAVGVVAFLARNDIVKERLSILRDKSVYQKKRDECTGRANTGNGYVNSSGLTDCGGELARKSLNFKSLNDIYRYYCYSGFGSQVYGCAYSATNTVYVCMPGTSVYDEKTVYWTYWYRRYQYISYSCNDADAKNTIRHELLHLVYSDLSDAEQSRVYSKLKTLYLSAYRDQLSLYSSSEWDDELFARVGADGRPVDDIEIAELYSKVVSAYADQKKSYYGSLVNMTDKYITKYDTLSNNFLIIVVVSGVLAVINIIFLIYLGVALSKVKNRRATNEVGRSSYSDYDDNVEVHRIKAKTRNNTREEFEEFKRKHSDVYSGEKEFEDTKKDFEEFKKKYGIIEAGSEEYDEFEEKYGQK